MGCCVGLGGCRECIPNCLSSACSSAFACLATCVVPSLWNTAVCFVTGVMGCVSGVSHCATCQAGKVCDNDGKTCGIPDEYYPEYAMTDCSIWKGFCKGVFHCADCG